MQHTNESKSRLAKLLATENIRVEFQKVRTAMFNLKERVLICPIWEDVSPELHDLLLGHEVGHALETPPDGWHDAVAVDNKVVSERYKSFLNVVEDARIEKKIKRRFPGIRQSFIKGYKDLLDRDFFGIKGIDLNTLSFIDRLNLYTKGGVTLGIKFNETESEFLSRVEKCETWQDVLDVTKDIFEYSKEEQKLSNQSNLPEDNFDFGEDGIEDDNQYIYDEDETTFEEDSGTSQKVKTESSDEEESEDTEESKNNVTNREKDSVATDSSENDEPSCLTDDYFRKNENDLVSFNSKPFSYIEVPDVDLSKVVTSHKIVHNSMFESFKKQRMNYDTILNDNYNEFKKHNDRYISLLVKEFEMRKAANKFSKQKISNTGDIDVSKIYKYKIDDNLFRKMTRVPKGKSHGLVLMFDRSGSMQNNMESSIEQILILSIFCKRVNIPFTVYGFGNDYSAWNRENNLPSLSLGGSGFSKNKNELSLDVVFLREYLNSDMKTAEFNTAVKNMCSLAKTYTSGRSRYNQFYTPDTENLSNTPMIEAMIALQKLTIQFKLKSKVDIVNTIIIHDGDADSINHIQSDSRHYEYIEYKQKNIVLRDSRNNCEFRVPYTEYQSWNDVLRGAIFQWYQKTTDCKIVGFFIVGERNEALNNISRRYYDESGKSISEKYQGRNYNPQARNEESRRIHKKLKENKFVESKSVGYSKFFLLPGGKELSASDESLEIEGKVTNNKIKNAFIKMNKKRQVSRVFVNKFITEIAV